LSFALWFILLGLVSLGIGTLSRPWFESPFFRILWAPGTAISGFFRILGARLAGFPVREFRFVRGPGRGFRVDISAGGPHRIILLGIFSYVCPVVLILAANSFLGEPLRWREKLPAIPLDSRAIEEFGTRSMLFLQEAWFVLKTSPQDPLAIGVIYILVGILLSNIPGKGESLPLWVAALAVGALHSLGVTLQPGSRGFLAFEALWSGLSLAFGFSLLTLAIAGVLGVIHRARHGPESRKG
jgi:hypothetical protein